MTTGDATRLFLAVVEVLDRLSARYLLIRNYEGYPEAFTGDVDLYVELAAVRPAFQELVHACESVGWQVMRTVDRPWVLVLQCVRPARDGERTVMVIELFDGFGWLQFPYSPFDHLWEVRTEHRGLPVLEPNLGALVTLAHYLFWAGFLPEKYQTALNASVHDPRYQVWRALVFGEGLGRKVHSWLTSYLQRGKTEWRHRPNVPEPIGEMPRRLILGAKVQIVFRYCLRSPIRGASKILEAIGIKLKELFVVRGDILTVRRGGWDILREIKRFHLYKNRNTILLKSTAFPGIWTVSYFLQAYWAISRGGLCIVEEESSDDLKAKLLRCIFRSHVKTLVDSPSEEAPTIGLAIAALR